MAMSKSTIRAQDIVNCHLCESETNIKWNCVDCELLMCDNCRHRIHPKFKNAKDHKIIDIKHVGLNTGQGERNLDFKNIECKQHANQACCLFCSSCDHLVCPSCVANQHTGHQFLEIKKVYEMKVERLKNGQKRTEKEKEHLINGNQNLDSIKTTETTKHQNIKQDIQNQREAVNLYSDRLLAEADKEMNKVQDSISQEKSKVTKILKILKDKEKQTDNLIHTTDVGKFFDNLGKLLDEKVDPINLNHRRMPQFVPGEIFQSNIGSFIEDTASEKGTTKLEMRFVQRYIHNIKHIHHTAVSPDGTLWIGDNTSKELQNIRLDRGRLTTISTLGTVVNGIVVTSDNKVLFTHGSSTLKQISDKGAIIDSKYNVHPLLITAVNFTTDQKLILGAISPGPSFLVTGRRVVIVMNQSGNQETIYEYDRDNQRILSLPISITCTTNENIFVIDRLSQDGRGRIVVLSPDGDILNTYNGHPEINTQKLPFIPGCVVTTTLDNVLITDYKTTYMYILNNTGYLTTQINCQDQGIIYPWSMAFSGTGQLFIGTNPPKKSEDITKLYKVEISGC